MRSSIARLTIAVVVVSTFQWLPAPTGAEEGIPSVRLIAGTDEVTAKRYGKSPVWIDPGVWVASTGGDFELRVSIADYGSPMVLQQVDSSTGEVLREIPAENLAGWNGLATFFRVRIENEDGKWVAGRKLRFCPATGDRQRVDDSGPTESRYPYECGGLPFVRGLVWGIDQGWSVGALGWDGAFRVSLKPGEYEMRMWIKANYADLLDVPDEDSSVTIDLTVKQAACCRPELTPDQAPDGTPEETPEPAVPETTSPDPTTLPNLKPTPALFFDVYRSKGRDYLAFAATEWNAGPQPLVVEGFRRDGEDVMDAFQYFYEGGEAVGRAPVGTLEYHEGGNHDHWHFEEFTEYSLLDAESGEAAVSGKQSWCLVPTDAIDLTVAGAAWQPWQPGVSSACGSPTSIWVREALPVGWGDTYFQYVKGQAFDVTDLPNGKYWVRVEVNPTGALYETDLSDNVVLRKVKLKGKAGSRWVKVPPYKGIETEDGFFW